MTQGEWYFVTWLDAATDATDAPDRAHVAVVRSPLKYLRTETVIGHKVKYHVFACSDSSCPETGWFAIPVPWLLKIERIIAKEIK